MQSKKIPLKLISLPKVLEQEIIVRPQLYLDKYTLDKNHDQCHGGIFDNNSFILHHCYTKNSLVCHEQYNEIKTWYFKVIKEKLTIKIPIPGEYTSRFTVKEGKMSLLQFVTGLNSNLVYLDVINILANSDKNTDDRKAEIGFEKQGTTLTLRQEANEVFVKYKYFILCQLCHKNGMIKFPFDLHLEKKNFYHLDSINMVEINTDKLFKQSNQKEE